MARGRLSDVEKFFIEGHLDMSASEIAEKLGRTEKTIKKYKDSLAPAKQEKPAEEKPKKKPPMKTRTNNSFARPEGVDGVVVATKASSEAGDDFRKTKRSPVSKKLTDCIAKVYPDE